jgi:hypothetical protein
MGSVRAVEVMDQIASRVPGAVVSKEHEVGHVQPVRNGGQFEVDETICAQTVTSVCELFSLGSG